MNLPALWAYGAGVTTGFLYPYFHHKYPSFSRRFATVVTLLATWPALIPLMAYDYYKTKMLPWEIGTHDDGIEE